VGSVVADARSKLGYEIHATGVEALQVAEDFPITPKEHGTPFLLDHRHLWIRSRRQHAILKIRSTLSLAIREFFEAEGFVNLDAPIFTPNACEGTSTLFATEYFGDTAYLTQSGQLYMEAGAAAFGKVYCFGPTFRAEKSKTRRHLTEFWMVEPEMAFFTLEDMMDMEEQFVSYIVRQALEKHRVELEQILERDTAMLENVTPPFPRISYDEAVERLQKTRQETDDPEQKELLKIEWGDDFGSPHETELTKQFDRPVFVYHYPTAVKAFYMTPVEGRPEACRSVDLLAPEGYGEITGGSERIHDLALIRRRVEEFGINPAAYEWYLDLRRFGTVPHSGFGLGVERTVAWICGAKHLREAVPFPRTLRRMYP
jgi:asparaginyl-tRNA synthetase